MNASKGYYSIASGRWVSHAEVVAAEAIAAESAINQTSPEAARRMEIEARAAAAADDGEFALARAILMEVAATREP